MFNQLNEIKTNRHFHVIKNLNCFFKKNAKNVQNFELTKKKSEGKIHFC